MHMICPAMLDNRLSQNAQDWWQSHKIKEVNPVKLNSWIDNRRKELSWGENPGRYIPGRIAITTTICNNDYTTHILRKCTGGWNLLNNKKRLTT